MMVEGGSPAGDATAVVEHADTLLLSAKKAGKNRVVTA